MGISLAPSGLVADLFALYLESHSKLATSS